MKKELATFWNLSVTVLRGKFEHAYDDKSDPDLYVTLHLPTASARTLRTKTINNCKTPVWNETFRFRVCSLAKNVLEIKLFDSDREQEEKCSFIILDISTLKLGQKETKEFITDDKLMDKLWLEFKMTKSPEAPVEYLSNGVLLKELVPYRTLSVTVLRGKFMRYFNFFSDPDLYVTLHLPTTSADTLRTKTIKNCRTPEWNETFHFHVCSLAKDVLEINLHDRDKVLNEKRGSLQFDISTLKLGQKETKEFITNDMVCFVWCVYGSVCSFKEDINVRLDFDIPAEEKEFLVKRRKVVSRALQRFLKLKTPLDPSKVPTVAVVCSGGGSRAMTGTYGSLKGLQSLGLLDVITYITSVSGSTWTSSSLYSDPDWSKKDLDKAIASAQKELSKDFLSFLSPEQRAYYVSELQERKIKGFPVSIIDLWGLVVEHLVFGKKLTGTLSDQKKAVSEGQNPLPIYTAVTMKEGTSGEPVPEWCEFTPFEVGFSKYGAFVSAENFGSEFCLGHMVKKLPETRIPFLMGIWSSFFSVKLMDIFKLLGAEIPSEMLSCLGDKVDILETDNISETLDTVRISPEPSEERRLCNLRPFISSVYNFLREFSLHNEYREKPEFNNTKASHPDAFPTKLTPADSTLGLVDSGLAINIGCPPVLRPHRRADVILCLENSWDKDRLTTLKQTQQYCSDHKLPFPNIDFTKYKSEPTREVYVFEDEDNPDAPIVICFPLANVSFKEYRAPGIQRRGEKERNKGNIDVTSGSSPYTTTKLLLASEDFQNLVDLTSYNILNNKEIIRNALKKALNKKGLVNKPIGERTNDCILA
ncbi:cytosolic phospholipase A2 epsilon-like [Clarias gariepinus]|uniref:cytosolic phospholipase A2 epsilon-like n=1 Tax=Clarias gariepinus TaxID=13013 RepID=UPI00234D0B95|nr:cytosolic phospholipase A2 epsilon-like [Clarias gariepinus]